MRILHCISSLEGGGAERQLCYLCAGLVQLGHEVDVAVMMEGVLGERLRSTGARVHVLGLHRRWEVPRLVARLYGLIVRRRPHLVQTWLRRMDIAGGMAARLAGRPWVYSERQVFTPGGVKESVRGRVLGAATAIIANSENGATVWRRMLGEGARLYQVENAVPLAEILATPPASRRALDVPEGAEVVLFVGRLRPDKGVALLATSLAKLLALRPRCFAICCGTGSLEGELHQSLAASGVIGRCRMLGFRSDVWSIMKAADVLLSTSTAEGRPNAIIEAAACGCPLVLSDIPAHPELVGDDGALYFPLSSAEAAVAAVGRALDDRVGAGERASRAARRITELSPIRVAQRHVAIYASLVPGAAGACGTADRAHSGDGTG